MVAWQATTASISTGLSSALIDATTHGKDIWTTFRDFMVKTIIDGAIKNAFASVINEGINSMMSAMSGVKFGGTPGGAMSSASSASSLYRMGSSLFSGDMSLANTAGTVVANTTGTGIDGLLATNGAYGTAAGAGATDAAATAASADAAGALFATEGEAAAAASAAGVEGTLLAVPGYGWVAAGVLALSQTGFGQQVVGGISDAVSGIGSAVSNVFSGIGSVFGFADGGDHPGGLRIVGENGPELEATGPSRIFNADQTASMLRSGGASNDEVVAELRAMRASLAQLNESNASAAASLSGRNQSAPLLVQVVTS
jgi:hypothetical protein